MAGARLTGAVLKGTDLALMRRLGADVSSCLGDPTAAAASRADELLGRAEGNQQWVKSGGREQRPAQFDSEDLRPLGDRLRGFILTAMSAKAACLVGLDLSGAQLQGANLEGADLRATNLAGADLRGARLAGANLAKADLRKADLGDLPLPGGRMNATQLQGSVLRYANLAGAELSGAQLDRTDLRGADLSGACVKGASLKGADLAAVVGLDFDQQAA